MKRSILRTAICLWFLSELCAVPVFGQEATAVKLPLAQMNGGRPLMRVLKERKSNRQFSSAPLPLQKLSNLLWAAFGENRPGSGKRTAPSAMNHQEISIYVALEKGLFLYDAGEHALQPLLAKDIRALSGRQSYVGEAALNLIYVADYSKMERMGEEGRAFYAAADSGFIAQNVYLYCASEGLATVVRGSIDRELLAKVMQLNPEQKITLAQSVGYPQK